MTSNEIEIAVARHFGWRQNVIVPNVSWGLGLQYEADMVVVRPSGWAMEVEIKTTRADIAADLNKRHVHDSLMFRQLWFAVPLEIANDVRIPEHAGILSVMKCHSKYSVGTLRTAKLRRNARKFTDTEIRKLLELGCMRVWSLKEHITALRAKQIGWQNPIRPEK